MVKTADHLKLKSKNGAFPKPSIKRMLAKISAIPCSCFLIHSYSFDSLEFLNWLYHCCMELSILYFSVLVGATCGRPLFAVVYWGSERPQVAPTKFQWDLWVFCKSPLASQNTVLVNIQKFAACRLEILPLCSLKCHAAFLGNFSAGRIFDSVLNGYAVKADLFKEKINNCFDFYWCRFDYKQKIPHFCGIIHF